MKKFVDNDALTPRARVMNDKLGLFLLYVLYNENISSLKDLAEFVNLAPSEVEPKTGFLQTNRMVDVIEDRIVISCQAEQLLRDLDLVDETQNIDIADALSRDSYFLSPPEEVAAWKFRTELIADTYTGIVGLRLTGMGAKKQESASIKKEVGANYVISDARISWEASGSGRESPCAAAA